MRSLKQNLPKGEVHLHVGLMTVLMQFPFEMLNGFNSTDPCDVQDISYLSNYLDIIINDFIIIIKANS